MAQRLTGAVNQPPLAVTNTFAADAGTYNCRHQPMSTAVSPARPAVLTVITDGDRDPRQKLVNGQYPAQL